LVRDSIRLWTTGTWGDSNCGGTLALAIKQCGYDGILFKGASDHPVYLYIDSKGPQLLDASAYWGKDAVDTEDMLTEVHKGKKKPAADVPASFPDDADPEDSVQAVLFTSFIVQ